MIMMKMMIMMIESGDHHREDNCSSVRMSLPLKVNKRYLRVKINDDNDNDDNDDNDDRAW